MTDASQMHATQHRSALKSPWLPIQAMIECLGEAGLKVARLQPCSPAAAPALDPGAAGFRTRVACSVDSVDQ